MKAIKRSVMRGVLGLSVMAAAVPLFAQDAVKTFRLVPSSELKVLDPIWTTALVTRNHGYMIYDTLYGTDANGQIKPEMVDKQTMSADGKVWTFTLRSGLTFHDGAPVTSDDVVASLARWGKRDAMGQRMYAAMDKVEAVSKDTFRMTFKEKYGAVLDSLGKPSSLVPFIMPKRMADTPADKQISENIGSGPYMFKSDEFRPGEKAVYTKFDKYVPRNEPPSGTAGGKVVKVPRVEWIVLKDAQTQVNALVNGEVDMIESVPFEHYTSLTNNIRIQTVSSSGGQYLLRFNHLVPPFNDVRIRQAAMLAMDQEALLRTQVGVKDLYKTCMSVYPCSSPFASKSANGMTEKPQFAKARQLLKEAGYDGKPVVLLHATDLSTLAKLPPVVAQLLRQAGFTVDMKSSDWGSVVARRAKKDPADQGGWNAFVTFWGSEDALNPINYAPLTANGEAGWFGWAKDEKLEQLRDDFARSTDATQRKKIAENIQIRAYEIGAFAPMGEILRPAAYRKGVVSGVLSGPANVYWNIEKN